MAILKDIKVDLKLGIFNIQGTWSADASEQKAAWELYVELITRIAVVKLKPNEGMLREALNSLQSLFPTTREILRKHGFKIASAKKKNGISLGFIAVAILNKIIRPLLAKWHPLLHDYEHQRKKRISALKHEQKWKRQKELRNEINKARKILVKYANILEQVIKIPSLITK